MRVFISHSSQDKPAVELLAAALAGRGFTPWLDKWEVSAGGDIVASINKGLDEADAGLIVFSKHSRDSRWVEAEVSYLTWARVQENKALIPVMVGYDAWVPPLLRPLARRGIEEIDAIVDALHGRKGRPVSARAPELGDVQRVSITLKSRGAGLQVELRLGEQLLGTALHEHMPAAMQAAQDDFLRGFRSGMRRDRAAAERGAMESSMADLGRTLGALCLPQDSGEALANLLDGCPLGTLVEVCVEAEGSALLGLPFEAMRLPDGRLLAAHASVVMWRRPTGFAPAARAPLAGPLKILVAVGAPDEGNTGSAVLDQERELQNILDAVEPMNRLENAQVRILEVGHPDMIAAAIGTDAYHVLHLSCHGGPGVLELENEDGEAVSVTPEQLLAPLKAKGRALPLVLLNACHGGVHEHETASFAEALLRAGVPSVLAMQTSVSDFYAAGLARAFYWHLTQGEHLRASRALAAARKEMELARLAALQRGGAALAETQSEYATATLFVAGDEVPLADFGADKQPLRTRPTHAVAGPVPQLRIDDLIGRRRELRETLRALRDDTGRKAGVVLTGIGGVGKSAVAGRVMQRLREDGWKLAVHSGRYDLASVALALGSALRGSADPATRDLAAELATPNLDDRLRLMAVHQSLAEQCVVLVLDDFEQNLTLGGGAFLDPDVGAAVAALAANARQGRLLITCRYPVPGIEAFLDRVTIGPLSQAEMRKLVLRLPALQGLGSADLARALHAIGGHPRMLEFLDALLRGGEGRLVHVTRKLNELLAQQGVDAGATRDQLDESLQATLLLGARSVFLDELLALARTLGIDAALLQAAVSNLPVTAAGLARMLADDPAEAGDAPGAERALIKLEDLSLVHRFADADRSAWVHRWTAEGLARVDVAGHRTRCIRAGRYHWWRCGNETHDLADATEAVRNFLAGAAFDDAVQVAHVCFDALRRFQQSIGIAALASEVLESLPQSHAGFASVADEEAEAHLALGETDRALDRYKALLQHHQRLAQAEPDRADYQRDLSVSYNKMGDLYRDLGQGELARKAFLKSLGVAERLAQAEPDRADYQRDLSVSYERMGDLYRALGQGELARKAFLKSLGIRERLAQAEPDRADYQRDLSVSYNNMGDLYRALGQGELAREAFLKSLGIAERLAQAEPDRADYQRDLVVSLVKTGTLDDPQADAHLLRAWDVLRAMDDAGRLDKSDEGMKPALKQMLVERSLLAE